MPVFQLHIIAPDPDLTSLSNIDLLDQFLERRESATVIRTYLKLTTTFSAILRRSSQLQKTLSENKERFVHSILKYRKIINLKFVLRLCNIKLIAGKDIRFSNSIVEAQNKIIKYHYLFKHDFKDIHVLRKLLDWIIPDYQYERPHHSLKGLTPHETLIGASLPTGQWQQQILEAKQLRLQENAKESCEIC